MTKRRRIKAGRLILVIILGLAMLACLFFGIRYLISLFDKDEESETSNTVIGNKLEVSINDYSVYEDKDGVLGFNFVVADMHFKDEKAIDYDLSHLMTEEGYKLNDIYVYQKKLNINSYDYDALKTVVDIISDKNEADFKIFIPYVDVNNSLILTETDSGKSFTIDLTKNDVDLKTIKVESTPNEIKTPDYDLDVSDNFISTMMTHHGESYDCSMLSVYTYKLTVKSIKEGVKVDSAVFIQSSTNEKWDALDATYSSYKIDNIIGKELKVNDEYALFFEVYSNIDDKPRYEGKITLYFSDGSSATIDTTLD